MGHIGQVAIYDKVGTEALVFWIEIPSKKVLTWVAHHASGTLHGAHVELDKRTYNFEEIPTEELKTLKIWGKLDEEYQKELIELESEEGNLSPKTRNRRSWKDDDNDVREAMKVRKAEATARKAERTANGEIGKRGRQADPRYVGLPRKIACTEPGCTKESGIGPGLLLEKAEEANQTWQEYVAAYKCRKCKGGSGRGRSADPKYAGVPREFPCSVCGKEIKMGPGLLLKKAEEVGITHQEFVKAYKCQKCGGATGRGRTANPLYANVPREMECPCGKKSGIGPGLLLQKVKESGTTMEEYLKDYRCRKCKKETR